MVSQQPWLASSASPSSITLIAATIIAALLIGLAKAQNNDWPQEADLGQPIPSEGCQSGPSALALASTFPIGSTSQVSIQSSDLAREFQVHVPLNVGIPFYKQPSPLVLMIHGGFGSGLQVENSTQMSLVSDEEGFYVIYPEAEGVAFNAGNGCCGNGPPIDVDYIRAVLDWAQSTLCVDLRRLYSTGFSNGAILSYGISCDEDIGNRLAAIAPVGGTPVNVCPSSSIPPQLAILHIHGTEDASIPIDGGIGCGLAQVDFASVEDAVDTFKVAAGCQGEGTFDFEQGLGGCSSQGNSSSFCNENIIICLIEGGGHSWPGGTVKSNPGLPSCSGSDGVQDLQFKASENIWAFFAAHPKPLPSLPLAPPSPPIEECPDNGDLNLDNVKNIQDVLLLLQEIVDG